LLEDILQDLDLVMIMSVNPGFGGQSFIEGTLGKLIQLHQLMERKKCRPLVEVDGGVTLENAGSLLKAGTDVLVAGNTVFGSTNPMEIIKTLKGMGKR
jgi:ribulose-phosphate 3-epimerase